MILTYLKFLKLFSWTFVFIFTNFFWVCLFPRNFWPTKESRKIEKIIFFLVRILRGFWPKKNFFLDFFWFFFKNINYGGSLYKRTDMNTSSIWTLVRSKFQVLSILYKFDKKKWLCLFPIFLWYCIYIQYSKNDDLYIYKKIFMGNRQTKFVFVKT